MRRRPFTGFLGKNTPSISIRSRRAIVGRTLSTRTSRAHSKGRPAGGDPAGSGPLLRYHDPALRAPRTGHEPRQHARDSHRPPKWRKRAERILPGKADCCKLLSLKARRDSSTVEHRFRKAGVVGSNPILGSILPAPKDLGATNPPVKNLASPGLVNGLVFRPNFNLAI